MISTLVLKSWFLTPTIVYAKNRVSKLPKYSLIPLDPYSRFRHCNKEIEITTLLSVQFFCENARHEQLRH